MPLLAVAAVYLLLGPPRIPAPERWVFPTPFGHKLGYRYYGNDQQIIDRLLK